MGFRGLGNPMSPEPTLIVGVRSEALSPDTVLPSPARRWHFTYLAGDPLHGAPCASSRVPLRVRTVMIGVHVRV